MQKRLNYINFLLTVVSFSGVVLVAQPEFLFGAKDSLNIPHFGFYIALMIFAALSNAFNLHYIHELGKQVHPFVNMLYSHLGFMASSSLLASSNPQPLESAQLTLSFVLILASIIVTGFMTQTLIFMANILKKPSLMMPIGYVSVIAAFLADVYLF